MAKERKTPQEKKQLSLEKDRRYIYGESSKGSRKIIPKRKKWVNKDFRRRVKQIIEKELNTDDIEEIELGVSEIKRKEWKKIPDAPLGEVIKNKKERRIKDHGAKQRRREHNKNRDSEIINRMNEICQRDEYKNADGKTIYKIALEEALEEEIRELKSKLKIKELPPKKN